MKIMAAHIHQHKMVNNSNRKCSNAIIKYPILVSILRAHLFSFRVNNILTQLTEYAYFPFIFIESISEWKQHDTSKCIVLIRKNIYLVRWFNRSHLFFIFLLYLNYFISSHYFNHFNLLFFTWKESFCCQT